MRNDVAQPIIKTWLDHIESGTPWIDPTLAAGAEFPTAHYTDPAHLDLERRQLFAARPHAVGLSVDLPEPGSFFTRDQFTVPLLLTRGSGGQVRALANVCAHRGSQVVGDPLGGDDRGCARRHACPYHAWTYDDAGTLVGVPDQGSFPSVEVPGPGLTSIPVVEAHGVIWAWPGALSVMGGDGVGHDGVSPLMAAPDLGAFGDDLDHFGIGDHQHWRHHRFELAMNWKLVVDTFLEPYHFASLHRATVGPIFFPNLCYAARQGDHVCHHVPRRSITSLVGQRPESWNIVPHSALVYVLFPATVFVMQIDHIETWRIRPDGDDPGRSICDLDFYIPRAQPEARTESWHRHWKNNWQLTIDTVEHEDFRAMAGVQRGLTSGAIDRVRFGANEPALIHFHQALTEAVETKPDDPAPIAPA